MMGRGEARANQLDPDALPWAVFENPWGKSELKLLRCSTLKESYTVIVRWPPGIVVPRHRHFGDVHVHTFKGRWHYKEYEWSAGPGSYVFEARGATHTLVVDEDTEAMFIVNGGQVDLSEDGSVIRIVDAAHLLATYAAGLAAQGLALPDAIISD
jgi:2,4'-dihydroxyacetophenone dioxygenase